MHLFRYICVSSVTTLFFLLPFAIAHEDHLHPLDAELSIPGDNDWNRGEPPSDWWDSMRNQHGHVGPWNVLGYLVGLEALDVFKTKWGRHDIDITLHTPFATPYSCMADGLAVGTGNSIGRLNLRLVEVDKPSELSVLIKRKDGQGSPIRFTPTEAYWQALEGIGPDNMEAIARNISEGPSEYYLIRRKE